MERPFSPNFALTIAFAALTLAGCKSDQGPIAPQSVTPSPQPASKTIEHQQPANTIDNEVVATVRGDKITLKDLQPVLMDSYGLKVLLELVQLNVVKQEAAKLQIVITPKDIDAEHGLTMIQLKRAVQEINQTGAPSTQPDDGITPAEAQQLLQQVLDKNKLSEPEFDILMEINAYLRAIAAPQVDAKITEDAIRNQFNLMYGEKVRVQYIECGDMAEAAKVHTDWEAGKPFEELSVMRTPNGPVRRGDLLPPFNVNNNSIPEEFRHVAFLLKLNAISDIVEVKGHFCIIKLLERIPPEHAKYEDYHDSVRDTLREQAIQAAMGAERQKLGEISLGDLTIQDPVLRKQWDALNATHNGEIHDQQEIRRQLDALHAPPTRPTTAPAEAAPATKPATMP